MARGRIAQLWPGNMNYAMVLCTACAKGNNGRFFWSRIVDQPVRLALPPNSLPGETFCSGKSA
jgi:hypothetical protein